MKLGVYLSSRTLPEILELESKLNLTDAEQEVFDQLRKGRSKVYTASCINVSVGTVSNRISSIKAKMERLNG